METVWTAESVAHPTGRIKRENFVPIAWAYRMRRFLCCLVLLAAVVAQAADRTVAPTATTQPDQEPPLPSGETAPDLNPAVVPPRPPPLIEIGDRFFGTGRLQRGFELPTGQVLTPDFTVFGTYRSALQAFHDPSTDQTRSEWANRLDVFGNLQLSGTERLLIGFRPLDDGVFAKPALAQYSGYQFSPDGNEGWIGKFKAEPTTLFFEGEVGQIFPALDPLGTQSADIGFSVGRQPLLYQDGLLLDDDIDAIGITRNTILPRGSTNAQITGLFGWNQINRGDGINHGDHLLLGLATSADFHPTTWNVDVFYVQGHDSISGGVYAGLSATRRFGKINSTFRILASRSLGTTSGGPQRPVSAFGNGSSAVGNGVLLFNELSYTVPFRNDLIYLDTFWGIDRFTSAARGPDRGGALGRVGILFAEQPIGRYGSALSSDPEKAIGFALGYQAFLDHDRRQQLVLETGGRINTSQPSAGALAAGAQYERAFGQHVVLQFGPFISINEGKGLGCGGRVELRYEF